MARVLFAALKREFKALLVAGRKAADFVAGARATQQDVGQLGQELTFKTRC
jgi:hypothetical protein